MQESPHEAPSDGSPLTEIRWAAHGSPYYAPERLDGAVTRRRADLEASLGLRVDMVSVDECMYERAGSCGGGSCANELVVREDPPAVVLTNRTSFVGVNARAEAFCGCSAELPDSRPRSCSGDPCLNGGTCLDVLGGYTCTCPADNPAEFGPDCERLAASFNGEGWSWQRGLEACGDARISLYFSTQVRG